LLAILKAEEAAGMPDPEGFRALDASYIEMLESQELKKLCAILAGLPTIMPR
jgi:hypothetical protein